MLSDISLTAPIHADVPVQTGYAKFNSDDPWSIVTAASGFTRDNTMSPLQGALIAATVANDGIMMEPYLVDLLTDDNGTELYRSEPRQASVVVEARTASELRELFQQTVRAGTSRKSFRQTVRPHGFRRRRVWWQDGITNGSQPDG